MGESVMWHHISARNGRAEMMADARSDEHMEANLAYWRDPAFWLVRPEGALVLDSPTLVIIKIAERQFHLFVKAG